GWARYTLDQEGLDYTLIADADLRRGGLENRFDVILFPNQFEGFSDAVFGIDPANGPLPFSKSDAFPSQGIPDGADDITGGMGLEGLINLRRFVEKGGVLVALDNAGVVPVEGGMVRRVAASGGPNTPGSEVRAKVLRPEHPIAYGFEERTSVFRGNGPIYDVADRDRGWVVMQFGTKKVGEEEPPKKEEPIEVEDADLPDEPPAANNKPEAPAAKEDDRLVLSGLIKDTGAVDGKPAILDVPSGQGRVILFSFNPLHRYLNLSDFRFVWNALLNWNDLP
ncbi:MAG TPA: peptidase, partial [Thermoanaerobaculia bacterium]|nr:peptidase [Thermoanaerobaculia bacterium]